MSDPPKMMNEAARPEERRGAGRAPTQRRAVLSLLSAHGSIVQGTAVDLSADGLRVHVPLPQLVGQEVEIRLLPRADRAAEQEIVLEGRVAWSAPLEGGGHAAGIRLYAAQPQTEDVAGRAEAEALLAQVREQLRARAEEGREALVEITRHAAVEDVPAEAPKRRLRWVALALLLLLLFLGSFAVLRRLPLDSWASRTAANAPEGDAPALDAAQAALLAGESNEAIRGFERLAKRGQTPAVRLIAALGHADTLRLEGRVPEALAVLQRALQGAEGAPEAWRTLADEFRADLLKQGGGAVAPPLLVQALDLLRPGDPPIVPEKNESEPAPTGGEEPPKAEEAPAPETAAVPPPPPSGPIRLAVDKSDYVLTVYRGERAVAAYPVGLGMNDTTPEGDFVIANKIENPDWYNRGESVKAGDPRNPLGAQWMGLGNKAGPTSYGIHPTKELSSIGGRGSRGCVRMRPGDAAALFRLCAVGTPVQIVE